MHACLRLYAVGGRQLVNPHFLTNFREYCTYLYMTTDNKQREKYQAVNIDITQHHHFQQPPTFACVLPLFVVIPTLYAYLSPSQATDTLSPLFCSSDSFCYRVLTLSYSILSPCFFVELDAALMRECLSCITSRSSRARIASRLLIESQAYMPAWKGSIADYRTTR